MNLSQAITMSAVLVAAAPVCAQEIPLARRAHMNEATRALYDRIRSSKGWLLGVGVFAGGEKANVSIPEAARALDRWRELYGPHTPACYEWELGEQPWEWRKKPWATRDWPAAKVFAEKGGIPWFRSHLQNFSASPGPNRQGSAWDTTGLIDPVLPGGAKHADFVAYFTELAREFKAFGHPCVFRLFHEMNGRWFWWGWQPEKFQKLWRMVFDIFQKEGANNVIWCWAVTADVGDPPLYYPGDDVVDIVGTDQYFDGAELPEKTRGGIATVAALAKDKPFFLAELGPVARADFWQNAEKEFPTIPRLRGFMVWFARDWKAWGSVQGRGSLIDETSPPEAMKAFKDFVTNPRTITLERFAGGGRRE